MGYDGTSARGALELRAGTAGNQATASVGPLFSQAPFFTVERTQQTRMSPLRKLKRISPSLRVVKTLRAPVVRNHGMPEEREA